MSKPKKPKKNKKHEKRDKKKEPIYVMDYLLHAREINID